MYLLSYLLRTIFFAVVPAAILLLPSLIKHSIEHAHDEDVEKLKKDIEKSGLSDFEYAKRRLKQDSIDKCAERSGEPDKLKALLDTYVNQRIITNQIAEILFDGYTKSYFQQIAKETNQSPVDYIFTRLPSTVATDCKMLWDNPVELEKYLKACITEKRITEIAAKILLDANLKDFSQKMKALGENCKLAQILKGIAPDDILRHCDTVAHKPVLLETYLMQCVNQDKITQETAKVLLEKYAQVRSN